MTQNRRFARDITCDFFRVSVGPQGTGDFLQLLEDLHTTHTSISARNLQTEDGYLRLHDWHVNGSNGRGALLRLRTDGAARIGRIDTDDIRDLQLNTNEALTDFFCFRYFGEFRTLVVHHNRDAGNYNRLSYYLEETSRIRPITFAPLIGIDALRLFERMQEITLADIKIAVPETLANESAGRSVEDMIGLAHRTGAATVSVHLSMEHTRRPLLASTVREIFGKALETQGQRVHSATVRGRVEQGGEIRTIDLINDRIKEKIRLEAANRSATLDEFYATIERAYERRRDEISRLTART